MVSISAEYAGEQTVDFTAGLTDYYCPIATKSHTPRVMKSLGLAEADVDEFCTNACSSK